MERATTRVRTKPMERQIIPQQTQPASDDAADLALRALGWILSDPLRAQRFLDLTGLTPDGLRASLAEPGTLAAVLDFLAAHEPDLTGAAEALEVDPARFASARERLGR
jgi:hypothetical protein